MVILFLAILLVGIFLRTYEFHDFLRFNPDQSRDAGVVRSYLTGESGLPLLGPKAGGTEFRVGPAFYYFQVISGKVFGDTPEAMAYPDLFFSILAIPLLFFFLRRYFDTRTAFLLMTLFAVSLYAVKYSRFAWNPNSLPFWSLLFLSALHMTAVGGISAKKYWSIVLGVAVGMGVQFHTLSLVFFPIVTLLTFFFLFVEKRMSWKSVCLTVGIALLLNTSQIVSEIQTGGVNTQAFFQSIGSKEKKGSGVVKNTLKEVVCYTQANAYILTSYDSDDGCSLKSVWKGFNVPVFIIGILFFIGGVWLSVRAFRKEQDMSKQYFLGITLSYLILSFLVLLPLANEISMRFFLPMVFMPFLFLGLWMEYIRERFPKYADPVTIILVSMLLLSNLYSIRQSFSMSKAYLTDSNAGMDNVLLREVELASDFIILHTDGTSVVVVDGDSEFLRKALKSMNYFTLREGIRLVQKDKETDSKMPFFLVENTKRTDKILQSRPVDEYLSFGRFTIFSLRSW